MNVCIFLNPARNSPMPHSSSHSMTTTECEREGTVAASKKSDWAWEIVCKETRTLSKEIWNEGYE